MGPVEATSVELEGTSPFTCDEVAAPGFSCGNLLEAAAEVTGNAGVGVVALPLEEEVSEEAVEEGGTALEAPVPS